MITAHLVSKLILPLFRKKAINLPSRIMKRPVNKLTVKNVFWTLYPNSLVETNKYVSPQSAERENLMRKLGKECK